MYDDNHGQDLDRVVWLFLLGVLLFASPLTNWLIGFKIWYLPYAQWFLLIVLGAWLEFLRGHRDI